MSRNRFREITKGDAPRLGINQRTGVMKLRTARGKAYGAVIRMLDRKGRTAKRKFTTDHEARAYRTELQERYEVFELTYQLELKLAARPWWRKALDWLKLRAGRQPYPDLVMDSWISRSPTEMDIAERQRLAAQIGAMA